MKTNKKQYDFLSAFLAEKRQAQKFGRGIVSSADLCYNGANEKPPLCKGRWQPKADGGIVKKPKIAENNPSVANATAPFTQGSLWICANIGVWASPDAFVKQMRNWRDKTCLLMVIL